ncbi:uncharacterized protein LOC122370068 [Amphibalanus amphitrite]|uniref:uncharacterized protein LOC122370068 n=1 Tax=Amphibalanus amphitrite TaxID=1232801 RepID=UPI001C8FB4C9|nr:uncharacterized protein LOC122370068 [Amphibalanus amphitrite]
MDRHLTFGDDVSQLRWPTVERRPWDCQWLLEVWRSRWEYGKWRRRNTDGEDGSTDRGDEDIARLDGELTTLKKNCYSLSEQVVGLEGDVATLKGDNATLKGDNTTLRQEVVHLREEVVRLRQAVLEERTTRQVVVEELRQEVRRRAAPSDRSQSDGEEVASPKGDTCDKCGAIRNCDVITQAEEEAGLAGGDVREAALQWAPAIYLLDHELLKMVLSKMDCWEMFRARRVCQRWRSAVDDIVSDCRRELTDQKTRSGEVPAPATSLELVLKVQDQPKMTELQAPTAETDTDLRLVAATCHALQKVNLRGFKLRVSALRRLARANASSLRELTLPAGISDWQLEALLEPLKALERLDVSPPVDSSGKWLRLLPQSLRRLDITGSGMTRTPLTFVRYPSEGLLVGVQLATDTLLDQLAALATHTVTGLFIYESPSVTPEATGRLLAALTSLKDVTFIGSGVISETVLSALHGCSQLNTLEFKDTRRLTDIPALTQSEVTAVSRVAVTCRKLYRLFLTSSLENRQAVLTALHETDLGCDGGQSRTIDFNVPKMETGQLQEEVIQMKEQMALLKEELTHRHQEDIARLNGELTPPKENCDHLSEQVVGLEGEVTTLKGDNATLKGDNAALRQEVVHLREEVFRLRQAVLEERTTRQVVVEELRQEVRRRAALSDRLQGDVEEVMTLKDGTGDKCDVISTCDVITQDKEEAGLAGGDVREAVPRWPSLIYLLDHDVLKVVLSKMDCWEMIRARRVCRRWRSAVDDIVGDCRRELTDQQTRGGKVPAPATGLELVLKTQDQPKMTELRAPTAETDTDLRLVADTCHALEKANLRGFKLRVSALRRLARANASSLRELTLPAGISDWQLEALLEPLKALERLDVSPPVDSSGKWLRLLPKSLRRLDITGSGMTEAPLKVPRWPTSELDVSIQQGTATLLDQVAVLATRTVTGLAIWASPSVTPEATGRLLTVLTSLEDVPLNGANAISETTLAALHCCSQLDTLVLYDTRPLADIPALTQSEVAAVCRMALTCRKLKTLAISSSTENCQAVLTALHETDLGCDSGQSRTINLWVPKSVYDKLTKPPNGSQITVYSLKA